MRRTFALCGVLFALQGCGKPNLENYVFLKHGASAKVVYGMDSIPFDKGTLTANKYLIPVGAITSPVQISAVDILAQRAAVWDMRSRCSHTAFNLSNLRRVDLPD